jgi:hypothetical protein
VDELYLVCLHPENKNKDYQRIKVANLQEEVQDLFQIRKNEIRKNEIRKNEIRKNEIRKNEIKNKDLKIN